MGSDLPSTHDAIQMYYGLREQCLRLCLVVCGGYTGGFQGQCLVGVVLNSRFYLPTCLLDLVILAPGLGISSRLGGLGGGGVGDRLGGDFIGGGLFVVSSLPLMAG